MTPQFETSAAKSVFGLPFREAEAFFRAKLNVPTAAWNDLWQAEHAKGFMTAGAMKADLLADLREAVDQAIAGNLDIKTFRARFDTIVQKHGWAYNGGRNWRSALIYDTNITTAYQAGRWQQFAEGGVQYLKYVHNDGVLNPRPEHQALDGTVRPIDDPFWATHYPPNGWGCQCRAVIADENELTGIPAVASDPNTVDDAWAYNVGQAGEARGYQVLTNKLETLPYEIAKSWTASMLDSPPFERFYRQQVKVNFPVAVLDLASRSALGASTQTVWFSPGSLEDHLLAHPDITLSDYQKVQNILDSGEVYLRPGKGQELERLVYLKGDGKLYRAAVKTTSGKDENFFLTLFETTEEKALEEVRAKYKRIR